MNTISLIYHSDTHHTHKMAEAIYEGAAAQETANVNLLRIQRTDIIEGHWKNEEIMQTLDRSDAIIFGCPTYMGAVSGPMKAFMDATVAPFMKEDWNGKLAAGFTVSGGLSGDKLNTLITMTTFAMQHGMVWTSLGANNLKHPDLNRLGIYFGAAGIASPEQSTEVAPNEDDKRTGFFLGKRVAVLCNQYFSNNAAK